MLGYFRPSCRSMESTRRRSAQRGLLLGILVVTVYIAVVDPALADTTIRVPWPIWLLFQIWYFFLWLISFLAWAATQLWNLVVAGINAFWVFLLFVVFVPLPKLILGVVLTLGGAFLPDLPSKSAQSGTVEVSAKKIYFRGAPRYAVCLVGIMIVSSALWQYTM